MPPAAPQGGPCLHAEASHR